MNWLPGRLTLEIRVKDLGPSKERGYTGLLHHLLHGGQLGRGGINFGKVNGGDGKLLIR